MSGMGLDCEPRSPAGAGGARRCSAQTRREFRARFGFERSLMITHSRPPLTLAPPNPYGSAFRGSFHY